MGFLKKLFGGEKKESLIPSHAGAANEGTMIDGAHFQLVYSVDAFLVAVETEGRCVLQLRTLTYPEVQAGLHSRLRERYGGKSYEYLEDLAHAPLLCAGCRWEFPDSYKMALNPLALSFFF